MNTRSAREYTMLALAQLLRKRREQRPNSQGTLDSNVTGELEESITFRVDLLLLISMLYRST
jgi:hypothetical protein